MTTGERARRYKVRFRFSFKVRNMPVKSNKSSIRVGQAAVGSRKIETPSGGLATTPWGPRQAPERRTVTRCAYISPITGSGLARRRWLRVVVLPLVTGVLTMTIFGPATPYSNSIVRPPCSKCGTHAEIRSPTWSLNVRNGSLRAVQVAACRCQVLVVRHTPGTTGPVTLMRLPWRHPPAEKNLASGAVAKSAGHRMGQPA